MEKLHFVIFRLHFVIFRKMSYEKIREINLNLISS